MMRNLLVALLISFSISSQAQEQDISLIKVKNGRLPEAKKLFERITGMKIPMSDARVHQMALHLSKNEFEKAAELAVEDPAFINVRARNFAIRLSNKAYSPGVAFNDAAALILGIIRDNTDFRESLTSNYTYEITSSTGYQNNFQILIANPWAEADSRLLDLHSDLIKVSGHKIGLQYNHGKVIKINATPGMTAADRAKAINSTGITTISHPDPAGIFSTRFFAEAQLSGGTNRRPVEYVVKNFLCSSLSEIGNNMASDAYVGKDVDRFPGGDHSNYTNNCKSCHTVMDGYRMAFSKTTFGSWAADMGTRQGISHGSMAASVNDSRNFWLRETFNAEPLVEEVAKKGINSQLIKAVRTVASVDPFTATSAYVPTAPETIAAAREAAAKTMTDLMLAPRTTANGKDRDAAFSKALRYNRFLSGVSISDLVWSALGADSDLKTQLKLANKNSYVKADFPEAWRKEEVFLTYAFAGGDFYIGTGVSEFATNEATVLQTIAANRTSTANIEKYTQDCLSQIVNALGKNDFPAFLKCEFDKNREKSLVGIYLLSKMTSAKASSVAVRGFTSLMKTRGIVLIQAGSINSRSLWYDYLRSVDNMIYFNAQSFDPVTGVHTKMNAGLYEFGFNVTDDTFYNLASSTYGWRGPNASGGKGMQDFGRMIGDSEAFSRCMTQKIVQSVCYKDLSQEPAILKKWSAIFEASGYKIKELTKKISLDPICAIVKRGRL